MAIMLAFVNAHIPVRVQFRVAPAMLPANSAGETSLGLLVLS
jgi:hypothetical protein